MNIAAQVAEKYIGYTEELNNSGFKDEAFEKRMESVGWQTGQAWCAYFTELVWKEAFPELFEKLDKLFSGGAVKTFTNFSKDSDFVCDKVPESGAVVIWQYYKDGKPHWSGHAGIVESIEGETIRTVEGNTNAAGGREGIEVAKKVRKLNFTPVARGLVLKGFIKIK